MPWSILLVKMGVPSLKLLELPGDYDDWFLDGFPSGSIQLQSVKAYCGEALPDTRDLDAMVVSGSPLSVTEPEPWMERTALQVALAAKAGTPVLAVCFGHQIVAKTFGGEAVRNPRGREIGTVSVALTPQGLSDPLFAGIESPFSVQATHSDVVTRLPRGATLLAENDYGIQAYRAGERFWGVQFHPELNDARMASLISTRQAALEAEGLWARAVTSVAPSGVGRRILSNFLEHVASMQETLRETEVA